MAAALERNLLGGVLSGLSGEKQVLKEKLEELGAKADKVTTREQLKAFISHRAFSLILAIAYTLGQPIAAVMFILAYPIMLVVRREIKNPYLKLWLSMGQGFITSFFSMWIIGAELGIVTKIASLLGVLGSNSSLRRQRE